MKCAICKKTEDEANLYPGVLRTRMVHLCEECAEDQKIPLIKKPSNSQLTQADHHYSVRERLDRMQGRRDTTDISGDQAITQRNLSKLRAPRPKQFHPDVLDNYYWTLSMARRRAKITHSQLAKKVDVESYIIQDIEKGVLPKDFKTIFLKLEALLGIKLLKERPEQISFTRKSPNKEKEILASVAEKMKNQTDDEEKSEAEELDEMQEVQEKIEAEELKLSRRKDIQNITLSDLVERKKAKEKFEKKAKEDEMLGDEIDLDEL